MMLSEVFQKCICCDVPRIPYVDENNKVTGCISLRKTIQELWIPDYIVSYADLLGDQLEHLTVPENHAQQVMQLPADRFVQTDYAAVSSDASIVKAIALMEKHATNHVFIIDEDIYKGIVTIDGIARRMLEVGLS